MTKKQKRSVLLAVIACLLAGLIYACTHRVWRLHECPGWEAWGGVIVCSRMIPGQTSLPLELTEDDAAAAIDAAAELRLRWDIFDSVAPVATAETGRFSLIYPGAAYIELYILPDGSMKGDLSGWDTRRRYTILNADVFSDFAEAVDGRPPDSRYSEWETFGQNAGCEIPVIELR